MWYIFFCDNFFFFLFLSILLHSNQPWKLVCVCVCVWFMWRGARKKRRLNENERTHSQWRVYVCLIPSSSGTLAAFEDRLRLGRASRTPTRARTALIRCNLSDTSNTSAFAKLRLLPLLLAPADGGATHAQGYFNAVHAQNRWRRRRCYRDALVVIFFSAALFFSFFSYFFSSYFELPSRAD